MNRGDIWWADLDIPSGSEPGYRRPVLIVQADAFNSSRIHTVVVIGLTTNLNLAAAPGNLLLGTAETGLSKQSVANVSQILTIDKSFLTEQVGQLDRRAMLHIDESVKLVLGL